ncbi:MAG TPA: ATP-binding protein [Gammaproteobacteria bacterium]
MIQSAWLVLSAGIILFLLVACAALARKCQLQGRRMRANRAQLFELTDTLPLGIACIDPRARRYLYVNPRYASLFGSSPEVLQGSRLAEIHQATFAELLATRCATIPEGGSATFEHEMPAHVEAVARRVRVSLAEFRREDGDGPPMVTAVVSDLSANALATERLQRQLAELSHVTRLATMGELAAKLAHELNQPLCAISGYTKASLRMMRSGQWQADELVEALEDASQQAERAADIIRGLRNFLRKTPPRRQPVDVVELVNEVVPLVRPEARRCQVEIEVQSDTELPPVMADRVELEQVLLNLLLNGIEAIDAATVWPRRVRVAAHAAAGGVAITVSDTGRGFVEGVAEHLFDPFFSTKPEGMGMGLAICRTIVESHGGSLRANNNEEGGATFTVRLPLQVEEESHAA